jgi:hypothetical protein
MFGDIMFCCISSYISSFYIFEYIDFLGNGKIHEKLSLMKWYIWVCLFSTFAKAPCTPIPKIPKVSECQWPWLSIAMALSCIYPYLCLSLTCSFNLCLNVCDFLCVNLLFQSVSPCLWIPLRRFYFILNLFLSFSLSFIIFEFYFFFIVYIMWWFLFYFFPFQFFYYHFYCYFYLLAGQQFFFKL